MHIYICIYIYTYIYIYLSISLYMHTYIWSAQRERPLPREADGRAAYPCEYSRAPCGRESSEYPTMAQEQRKRACSAHPCARGTASTHRGTLGTHVGYSENPMMTQELKVRGLRAPMCAMSCTRNSSASCGSVRRRCDAVVLGGGKSGRAQNAAGRAAPCAPTRA